MAVDRWEVKNGVIVPTGFGLGMPWQNAETNSDYYNQMAELLGYPAWYNWKYNESGTNYFPMVWDVKWLPAEFNAILNTKVDKAKIWFLGNEPEIFTQSNTTPEVFVKLARYWKRNIGLPFAVPGILWDEAGRQWFKKYQELNGPRPDYYHIHIYAWNKETWESQLADALKVFHDRPLIITECGGHTSSAMVQSEIMIAICDSITAGNIQAAFWFSSHYSTWKPYWINTDLTTRDGRLTAPGYVFPIYMNAQVVAAKKDFKIYLPVTLRNG